MGNGKHLHSEEPNIVKSDYNYKIKMGRKCIQNSRTAFKYLTGKRPSDRS